MALWKSWSHTSALTCTDIDWERLKAIDFESPLPGRICILAERHWTGGGRCSCFAAWKECDGKGAGRLVRSDARSWHTMVLQMSQAYGRHGKCQRESTTMSQLRVHIYSVAFGVDEVTDITGGIVQEQQLGQFPRRVNPNCFLTPLTDRWKWAWNLSRLLRLWSRSWSECRFWEGHSDHVEFGVRRAVWLGPTLRLGLFAWGGGLKSFPAVVFQLSMSHSSYNMELGEAAARCCSLLWEKTGSPVFASSAPWSVELSLRSGSTCRLTRQTRSCKISDAMLWKAWGQWKAKHVYVEYVIMSSGVLWKQRICAKRLSGAVLSWATPDFPSVHHPNTLPEAIGEYARSNVIRAFWVLN